MEELLVKINEKPSKKYGKFPISRNLDELFENGIILLDKDPGITSHQCVDNLKKTLGIEKAGHSGTLDPNVCGVLLIGLGNATRIMEYMLKSNKEYVCLLYLHKPVEELEIRKAFAKFTGKIMQMPPIISAIKRQLREREIYYNKILEIDEKKQYVLFRVGCQHGTYIRKLCSDIGDYLKVKGQMVELRRTKAGPFEECDRLIGLDKLRNIYQIYLDEKDEHKKKIYEKEIRKYILPMEDALVEFKKVYVRDSAVNSICHGADLALPGVYKFDNDIKIGEEIVMLSAKGELIGIGRAFLDSKSAIKKRKGAFVKTNKVFMAIDTYPSVWKFVDREE